MTSRPARLAYVLLVALISHAAVAQTAGDALDRAGRLQRAGDLDGAVASYREALRLAPGRIEALSGLGFTYLRQGRLPEAIESLRTAREAAPQHPGIAYYLGLAYFQSGQFAGARGELEWVLQGQPSNHQAMHLYGLCQLKLNEISKGIDVLGRVLQLDPRNRQAAYTLVSVLIRDGQVGRADDLLQSYLAGDLSPETLLIKGSLQLARKEYPEALATLERVLASGRRLATLHSQVGVALLYRGDRERAAREFEAELSMHPEDFNANAFLGWLLQQDGESDRALKLLRTAHALNARDSGVQYLLAQVQSSRGSWREARTLLEQVVMSHPAFTPAHVLLARAYAKLKLTDLFREQQAIIARLNASQQERDLQGVDQLYDGRVLAMPKK